MVLNLNEYQPKKVIFEKSPENEWSYRIAKTKNKLNKVILHHPFSSVDWYLLRMERRNKMILITWWSKNES
jgi:chlorite dismutase